MKKQPTCHHSGRTGDQKALLTICLVFLSLILFFPVKSHSWPLAATAAEEENGKQQAVNDQPDFLQETKSQTKEKTDESQETAETDKNKTIKDWLEPWKKTLELSYVVTGGNTVTSSFSLGNTLLKTPNERDSYLLKTFFLRTHSTTVDCKAVGSEDSFSLIEEKKRKLTAENYLIQAQYDHRPSGRLLANLGFSWDRNKFAGVEGRALWTAGGGIVLADSDTAKVKSSAGLTLTLRKYSGQKMSSFIGFQYAFFWKQKLLDNASFETGFVFDDNLKRLSDWHYDWTTSLMAPLTKSLALKASVRVMRNNRPPEAEVPLYSPDNIDTGLTVLIPRRKADTFFTTTIVINF
ncbi:MAG TPA: DUF481 domain-containing protein [Candidatus Saccharicenans sp.]|jgi:putative salt-induced outer membrane protein YdiY|nr:DUF481 domain-containing protein [Candidatus Saccharicenans sp.]HRD02562.1 DUF481 domain-containing protein [Candidatus Saccharicenans sp.]